MARRYDSSRRRKAAEQTRDDILRAALKLHWEGVTELEPLAEEAGCSLATVRKHFPTKEMLFQNCTRTFGESLTLPDLEQLSKIRDPRERLEECVSELCRIHEAMFGYAWHGAHLRRDSEVLDEVMSGYEGLADAIAKIVVPGDSPRAATVRGLLDFLTYRALRLSGKLSPEAVRTELTTTLSMLSGARNQSSLSKNKR
jgi:AcrR family transcriptional regulator